MIIAEITFPKTYQKNKVKQNTYLSNIKNQALTFLRLEYYANNRNIRDEKVRLSLLEEYINKEYNLDVNLFDIISYVITNLKYDVDRKYIVLDNEIKLKGVKLLTLIQIIKFGTLELKGSSIISDCLKYAVKAVYAHNFLVNFKF